MAAGADTKARGKSNGSRKHAGGSGPRTLAIDIGGTGLKALVLDSHGQKLTERVRVETPKPATPEAVMNALVALVKPLAPFDRMSVGFPGVVASGSTLSAPNLDKAWRNFDLQGALERRLK